MTSRAEREAGWSWPSSDPVRDESSVTARRAIPEKIGDGGAVGDLGEVIKMLEFRNYFPDTIRDRDIHAL